MTIIKQTGVQSSGHMKNLRGYINDDRKVILRDSLNMDGCTNPKRWAHHMWMTREAYGHNKAARRVRDKKTGELKEAKNTILFHQILGFNPDECDLNGGWLSPEECMRYAKEYVGKHYPNQQIVMALHNEYCKADKTHRYAVHIVINRTDLSTGKRLDEGRGKSAKVKRASRIRDLDHEWGLKQVVEGERNSSVHKKQPSRIEKELAARGIDSYKTNLRELCRIAAGEAENIYDYRELLESWGVDTEFKKGRMYVTDTDNNRYAFLFEQRVYRHFTQYVFSQPKERLKWGYRRIVGYINLYATVKSLLEKKAKGITDYTAEAAFLQGAAAAQEGAYRDLVGSLNISVEEMKRMLRDCLPR